MKQRFIDYSPTFWPLVFVMLLVSLLVGAAKAAFPTPLYDHTVINVGDLRQGDKVCGLGMSNMKGVGDRINFPGITYVNAASGGAVMSDWATGKPLSSKGRPMWSAVPADCGVFLINDVNRLRSGESMSAYRARLESDVGKVLTHISKNFNPRQAWLMGLHGEPYAPINSKQNHEASYQSAVVADTVSAAGGYSFAVIHTPYVWANDFPRGDGLAWLQTDFNCGSGTPDWLHLCPDGYSKWAGLIHEAFAAALNGAPPIDPPPAPGVTACADSWIPPQDRCQKEQDGTICHCGRNPETWTLIGDVSPPADDPPTDPQDCPVPGWATQCKLVNNICKCR